MDLKLLSRLLNEESVLPSSTDELDLQELEQMDPNELLERVPIDGPTTGNDDKEKQT